MDLTRLRTLASREEGVSHLQDAILGVLKGVWTSLPVIVAEDSDGHTMKAQSAINLIVTLPNGSTKSVKMEPFDTTPVHYPGGGGVTDTHPVKKGDEGIVHFLSRAQDLHHQKGGVQDPVDNRSHHLADSRYHAGGRSDPRKLNPPVSSTSGQKRSDDGKHVMDLHPQNGITHASTEKVLTNVGGQNGSGTLHLVDKILKNAKKVLINCIKADNFPDPGASFANKKLIATKPVGAMNDPTKAISSIMSQVMSGGIGSVLSNPTATAGGSMNSAITSAISSLTSSLGSSGASSLVSGLGSLSSALNGLVSGAGMLSGANAPASGSFSLSDVLSHAQNLTQFFGTEVPPSVDLSHVLAPLNPGIISSAEARLSATIAGVLSGIVTIPSALQIISGLTDKLNSLMPAASNAMATLQMAVPVMNLAQAAASAKTSLDPNEAAVGGVLSGSGLAQLSAAINLLFEPTVKDSAVILSFPDGKAIQPGAQAGFATA